MSPTIGDLIEHSRAPIVSGRYVIPAEQSSELLRDATARSWLVTLLHEIGSHNTLSGSDLFNRRGRHYPEMNTYISA
jgi:hypothetical protein